MMRDILDDPGKLSGAMAGVAAAMLASAFAMQYLGGLQPCVLCIWQRWPYAAAIVLGVAGLALARRGASARPILALLALTFVVGAGLGVFHVGVEQQWWTGLTSCSGPSFEAGMTTEELRDMLMAAPIVRCDDIPFSMFGISLAGYNVLASAALALVALAGLRRAGHQAVSA